MDIKLLSYNIQSWDMNERRKTGVVDLIKKHNPDVICLQEVTVKWFSLLKKELSDKYYFTGRDRFFGDHTALIRDRERNCVLYKKDRFTQLYSHTYWYGDDIKTPSITEEAVFKRIFTCVGLKDRKTNKIYEQISTHLEYTTAHCRELQAKVLVNYLKKQNKTIVIAGDFNSPPEENAYQLVTSYMKDVGLEFNKNDITYHAYNNPNIKQERIDYVFRTANIEPKSFEIIKDKYDELPPSDHYPLECIFEIE